MSKAAELAALIGSQSSLSNRNLIINGAMQVAQRGTSETGATTSGYYTTDRWEFSIGTLGTWTVSQSTTAPDGFSNSYKLECTTADASPAVADNFIFKQKIEGQNLQHLKYGTASARPMTLSFWVRSSKTGTYVCELLAPDASNRHINKSYTISSADTWEYKTITFAGDSSGVINNDNGIGLQVNWWLGSGSGFSSGTLQTSWGALDQTARAVGNVNLADTIGNDWYITGVQLELGEQATPFEHRSYGDELARCQRYYQSIDTNGRTQTIGFGHRQATNTVRFSIPTPVALRADPSISISGTVNCMESDGSATATTSISGLYNSNGYVVATGTASGVVAGSITMQGYGGTVQIDAEL